MFVIDALLERFHCINTKTSNRKTANTEYFHKTLKFKTSEAYRILLKSVSHISKVFHLLNFICKTYLHSVNLSILFIVFLCHGFFFFVLTFLFVGSGFYLCRENTCAVTLVGHHREQTAIVKVCLSWIYNIFSFALIYVYKDSESIRRGNFAKYLFLESRSFCSYKMLRKIWKF